MEVMRVQCVPSLGCGKGSSGHLFRALLSGNTDAGLCALSAFHSLIVCTIERLLLTYQAVLDAPNTAGQKVGGGESGLGVGLFRLPCFAVYDVHPHFGPNF